MAAATDGRDVVISEMDRTGRDPWTGGDTRTHRRTVGVAIPVHARLFSRLASARRLPRRRKPPSPQVELAAVGGHGSTGPGSRPVARRSRWSAADRKDSKTHGLTARTREETPRVRHAESGLSETPPSAHVRTRHADESRG